MDKAYIRTLEMFIAIVITFIFLMFVIPKNMSRAEEKELHFLAKLEQESNFRNCVISSNISCINSSVSQLIPSRYDYTLITDDKLNTPETLPLAKIGADSIMIKGNMTNSTTKFVQVFYWKKI